MITTNTTCALVTGGTSGIGREIANLLCNMHFDTVFIAARHAPKNLNSPKQTFIKTDLTDRKEIENLIKTIKKHYSPLSLLVNCAGTAKFGPHETVSTSAIYAMFHTNLIAPVYLSKAFMPMLKQTQGTLINVSSMSSKKVATHAAAYAASKAALNHFSRSLFEEVRKQNVKIVNLVPDMTDTPFYDQLPISVGDDPQSYLSPKVVAEAVEYAIKQPPELVITELVIQPQKHQIKKKKTKL